MLRSTPAHGPSQDLNRQPSSYRSVSLPLSRRWEGVSASLRLHTAAGAGQPRGQLASESRQRWRPQAPGATWLLCGPALLQTPPPPSPSPSPSSSTGLPADTPPSLFVCGEQFPSIPVFFLPFLISWSPAHTHTHTQLFSPLLKKRMDIFFFFFALLILFL